MKIELYLDGHRVEINDDIDFVLNRQYTELTDLTSIIVDYSKTISIPMTPTNNELFNNVYKLNRQVVLGTEYVDYDPSKRIPMIMTYNSSIVMDGYAILNKVNLKAKTYEINIYGQLGKIFNELKEKKIGNYTTSNVMMNNIKLNRNYVGQSWSNDSHTTDWTSSDWTEYFGFAPQLLGKDSGFLSTTEYEDINSSNEFKKFEDLLTDSLESRKPLIKNGLDVNQYGEIRSYTTRPYVYVDKLIQLIKNEINDHPELYNGYRFLLDGDWFNDDNPYYSKMVYFPGQESMVTDERSVNGTLTLVDTLRYVFSVPYNVYPTVQSSDLEGYSYTLDGNGLFTFTNEDGGMAGVVSINANNVRIVDEWEDVSFGQGDVNSIVFGLYNKNITGFPIRYLDICDEYDNLIYRLVLTEQYIHDTQYDSSFLSWTWTQSTSGDLWEQMRNLDDRCLVPSTATSVKQLTGTTFTRTQTFSFPSINLDTNKFKFKFGCMAINGNRITKQNLDFANDTFYPRIFKNDNYRELWTGTHSNGIYIPTSIAITTSPHRSDSDINISDILGNDFCPFTWLIDYVKKFRLFFDIDYQNKTIVLTDRYFHTGGRVSISDGFATATIDPITKTNIIVDYDKEVVVEPLVNNYKAVKYNYRSNESIKGTQYKKKYGVEYGDLEISTGLNLNSEVMDLISEEEESVMIPTVTNNFTWTSYIAPTSIQLKPSQLLRTNKVINTLDKDGKIQYFPFYCFRLENVEFTYDSNTPETDKIRISDDTPNQKNYAQYCYLSADDTTHQTVMNFIPQFDNYVNDVNYIYWATFAKPRIVYNGNVDNNLGNFAIYDRWKNYLNEIFNQNNKKVTCYVRMSYPEFINFKFNQLLLIDGSQFLVNKIIDFNPNSDAPTKVELIQIQDENNLTNGEGSQPVPPVEYTIYTNHNNLKYTYDGQGATNISVWSYEGQARLYAPSSPWFNIVQTGSEPLYDTDFYKLTYRIEITANTGAERSLEIKGIIDGVSEDVYKKIIPVVQYQDYGLTVSPSSFEIESEGEITYIYANCNEGFQPEFINNNPWIWVEYSLYDESLGWRYMVTVAPNITLSERNTNIFAQIRGVPSSKAQIAIPISQDMLYDLSVVPSSLTFNSQGGIQSLTIDREISNLSTIFDGQGFCSLNVDPNPPTGKTVYRISCSENTGTQRQNSVTVSLRGVDTTLHPEATKTIIITQDGQQPAIEPLKFTSTGITSIRIVNGSYFNFEMSYDGYQWFDLGSTTINLSDGAFVYIRGNNPDGINKHASSTIQVKFVTSGNGTIACEGNIMSLIDGVGETTVIPCNYCFYGLFDGCSNLTSAPELPATTLTDYCYSGMFKNCISLAVAPELPATTLTDHCYSNMFSSCSNLNAAPELPATTLANGCYEGMFNSCTRLTVAPELPATTLAVRCYYNMFYGCSYLTTAPELPATTLTDYCYYGLFDGCSNLTSAPELPATTLADYCYEKMFNSCTRLTVAPELPATTLADHCYSGMFGSCSNLNAAPELPATTLADYCYEGMFNHCSNLTTAPELPATTLADHCYSGMFNYCSNLTTAPELPATTLADHCYEKMFQGCSNLTTAPELPATTLFVNCYKYMFNLCSSLIYIKCLAVYKGTTGYATLGWCHYVSSGGTFVKHPDATWSRGEDGIPSSWTIIDADLP